MPEQDQKLLEEMIARAACETRNESLRLAVEAGADRATLELIADAIRVSRGPEITLPRGRYGHCSRATGWARKGRGDSAEWGERTDTGYRVGPGNWLVHSSDGFRRSDRVTWVVRHVTVGTATWTVAS